MSREVVDMVWFVLIEDTEVCSHMLTRVNSCSHNMFATILLEDGLSIWEVLAETWNPHLLAPPALQAKCIQ